MEQYIDKDALVAEIKKLKMDIGNIFNDYDEGFWEGRTTALDDVIYALVILEVKEVDLEKHLKEDIEDVLFDLNGVAVKGATHYLTVENVKDIAKHFFELGLKVAQKGE